MTSDICHTDNELNVNTQHTFPSNFSSSDMSNITSCKKYHLQLVALTTGAATLEISVKNSKKLEISYHMIQLLGL